MANKIQIRRDTAANWTSTNPTLSQGEQGYEIDTSKFKIGDGTTAWTSLSYFSGYTDADVDTHLNTSTATNGEYLSWDGSDYDWATVPAGYTNSDVDTHLNTSTATSGEVLSWTGTDYDWITAGGGGADLFAENYDGTSTLPSATGTNSVAIGAEAVAAIEQMSIAIGKSYSSGLESIALGIGNNSASYGATSNRSFSVGYLSNANGANGVSIGAFSQCASSSTAIGYGAHTAASNSTVFGSYGYTSGQRSLVLSNASATQGTKATQTYAVAIGNNSLSDVRGKYAFSNGSFSAVGDSQTGTLVMRCDTTDATPEVITTENSTPSYRNQINLPDNSCYGFTGTVIAREDSSATNDFAVWEIKGGAVRAASASTTALGTYNINKISESTGATNWSIALSADTTNGAVAITVTGEASHNIRWVATVNTTEVTY